MRAISRACPRKHICKFDKLRDSVYVHWNLSVCWKTFNLSTTISTDPLYVALTRKQLVTDTDTPREYVSEWEVAPPGGSAHILQNDRLSVQHLACYIHNTEAVERS